MESRAKAAGHSIHQQLVNFPLGLLTGAVVFDIIGLVLNDGRFTTAGYLMIAAGVLMGLLPQFSDSSITLPCRTSPAPSASDGSTEPATP